MNLIMRRKRKNASKSLRESLKIDGDEIKTLKQHRKEKLDTLDLDLRAKRKVQEQAKGN